MAWAREVAQPMLSIPLTVSIAVIMPLSFTSRSIWIEATVDITLGDGITETQGSPRPSGSSLLLGVVHCSTPAFPTPSAAQWHSISPGGCLHHPPPSYVAQSIGHTTIGNARPGLLKCSCQFFLHIPLAVRGRRFVGGARLPVISLRGVRLCRGGLSSWGSGQRRGCPSYGWGGLLSGAGYLVLSAVGRVRSILQRPDRERREGFDRALHPPRQGDAYQSVPKLHTSEVICGSVRDVFLSVFVALQSLQKQDAYVEPSISLKRAHS